MKTRTRILTAAILAAAALFTGGAQAKADGYCREYTRTVDIGGQPRQAYGTACLGPDGAWRITDENLKPRRTGYVQAYSDDDSDDTVIFVDQPPVVTQRVRYVPVYPAYRPHYRPYYREAYYAPAPVVFSFGYGNDRHRDWHHNR